MLLAGIYLHNYGVLQDVAMGLTRESLQQKSDIRPILPLSALIGRNSTGKSSFIDALSFICDALRHGVPYAATLNGRGGFSRLLTAGSGNDFVCHLIFTDDRKACHLSYELQMTCDSHGRPYVSREKVIRWEKADRESKEQVVLDLTDGVGWIFADGELVQTGVEDRKYPALAAFGVIRSYPELCRLYNQINHWFFQKNQQPEKETAKLSSQGGHKHLNSDCSNVQNVLLYYQQEHPEFYNQMMRRINEKIGETKSADQAYTNGDMTSGNLKLFTYLLLLEDPDPRPLLCLEQPDVGLYHEMVDILAREMRAYTIRNHNCQIIYTTHNPYLLESMSPDEVWIFEKYQKLKKDEAKKRGFATVRCAGSDELVAKMYQQGVGLGAIWYGGHFEKDN